MSDDTLTPQSGPHLIYFADPMCSWCWGFSPVIGAIIAEFGARLPVRLILGGLRPGTTSQLQDAQRAELARHWHHVHEASGQAFDPAVLQRPGFIYDTDPAARAVVLMRRRSMADALAGLARLQRGFYAQNRDVTDTATLAAIAAEMGFDEARFAQDLQDEDLRLETWRDYAISQNTGVRGFPTLIAGSGADNQYQLVAKGYEPAGRVLPALRGWLAGLGGAPATEGAAPSGGQACNRQP